MALDRWIADVQTTRDFCHYLALDLRHAAENPDDIRAMADELEALSEGPNDMPLLRQPQDIPRVNVRVSQPSSRASVDATGRNTALVADDAA